MFDPDSFCSGMPASSLSIIDLSMLPGVSAYRFQQPHRHIPSRAAAEGPFPVDHQPQIHNFYSGSIYARHVSGEIKEGRIKKTHVFLEKVSTFHMVL